MRNQLRFQATVALHQLLQLDQQLIVAETILDTIES
jgi:hypothetical protein